MKISPQQYAQVLVESIKDGNVKTIAKNFWLKLQKNGQHKDLSKILDALDQEYARLNGKVLAEVYSEKELTADQLKLTERKLKKQFDKEAIIKNIVNEKQTAGIIVKVNEEEIDLSLGNKMSRLKQILTR